MKSEIIEQALPWPLLRGLALALVRLPGREEVQLLFRWRLGVGNEVLEGLDPEGGKVWLCFCGLFGLDLCCLGLWVVFLIYAEGCFFGGICAHLDAAFCVVVLQQRSELSLHQICKLMKDGLISSDWFMLFGLFPEGKDHWSEHLKVAAGQFDQISLIVIQKESLRLLSCVFEKRSEDLENIDL